MFLRKLWHVSEQNLFQIVRPSAGETSIHVCVDLAFTASTACHRATNVVRNLVCFVVAQYLADSWVQDGFSDAESNRSGLSYGAVEINAALGHWQDDEPQQEDIPFSIDEDVWHMRGGGLISDNPDEAFQQEDETPCEDFLLELLAKKPRSEDFHSGLMVPTFMGDAGFEAPHLDAWRQAEARVGIVNAASKATKCKKAAPPTPPSQR